MTAEITTSCRSCGEPYLQLVIDLGEQPLANSYHRGEVSGEKTYPLKVLSCPGCTLLQLSMRVDPRDMFDDYLYLSSYSTGMVQEMTELADRLVTGRSLGADALVVEVASNDGYLLKHYVAAGVPVLGIEPAERPALIARQLGVNTRIEYFGRGLAAQLVDDGIRADVLHANNVLAHVPDINDFVSGIATLLAEDGLAVIETPYAVDMIAKSAFDTIYHEHVFYYTVTALQSLFLRHGLTIDAVERVSHHGGSLRLQVVHGSEPGESAETLLAREAELHVGSARWYSAFPEAAARVCSDLLGWLAQQAEAGRTVAGYGAAAKGTVLLNRAAVGEDRVAFVVDLNPAKQGLRMPGTGQEILAVEELLSRNPASCIVLAWNHASEVYAQLHEYRSRGGELFVAVPQMRQLP